MGALNYARKRAAANPDVPTSFAANPDVSEPRSTHGPPRSGSSVGTPPGRVGLAGVSSDASTRMSGLNAVGFRWNTGDENVDYWYPQGITGTSDHSEALTFDDKRLLIVSWYNKTDEQPSRGARITIADITDLGDVSYRHLLLVEPFEGDDGPDFGPAEYDSGVAALHVGGIAWYGPYLYVADTVQGLRVYDMERIFRPSNFDDTSRIGVSGDRADAHGYLYAVPRIGRFRLTSESCRVRFSFVGMNPESDPPVLITGEYITPEIDGRLVTWPLDPETHELETREGTTRAQEAVVIGQNRAQGALWIDGSFYVSASSQDGGHGRLYKGRPGVDNESINWVRGAEDLYWERSHGLMWTPAEHPGTRDVVGVPVF